MNFGSFTYEYANRSASGICGCARADSGLAISLDRYAFPPVSTLLHSYLCFPDLTVSALISFPELSYFCLMGFLGPFGVEVSSYPVEGALFHLHWCVLVYLHLCCSMPLLLCGDNSTIHSSCPLFHARTIKSHHLAGLLHPIEPTCCQI